MKERKEEMIEDLNFNILKLVEKIHLIFHQKNPSNRFFVLAEIYLVTILQ